MKIEINVDNTKLYKGVFWIKNANDIYGSEIYYRIHCDKNGNCNLNSSMLGDIFGKSGNTINHEKLWGKLPKETTDNKEFDYYPRGRVEISNGKAKIFMSQYLVDWKDKVVGFVKEKYNLSIENEITEIKVILDGSEHYRPKILDMK